MDIGLGSDVSVDALRTAFARMFPGCRIDVVENLQDATDAAREILVLRHVNSSEFPTGISVFASLQPGSDFEAWLRELARTLSETLTTRTIMDGSPYGDTAAPYWSLLWDSGLPYLADDADSAFADGEGGPVRVVRPLSPDLFRDRVELSCAIFRAGRDSPP